MDELTIVARFVHFAAVSLLVGLALFRGMLARGALPAQAEFDRQARRAYRLASALALASALGWLAAVAAEMTGSWAELALPDTWTAIGFDTHFGLVWRWRLALNVVLVALLVGGSSVSVVRMDWLVSALASALAASLIGVGHAAAGEGLLSPAHLLADALHLLCAASWLGGLFGLWLLLRSDRGEVRDGAYATTIRQFSRMAYGAVGLLLLTGCVNSLILLRGPTALLETPYGRVLLVKLGLVVVMLTLAALNRLVLSPRILAGNGVAALSRSVTAELAAGLLVLAAVAVLGTIHPVF